MIPYNLPFCVVIILFAVSYGCSIYIHFLFTGSITHRRLYEILCEKTKTLNPFTAKSRQILFDELIKLSYGSENFSALFAKQLKFKILSFTSVLYRNLEKCSKNRRKFESIYKQWLDRKFELRAERKSTSEEPQPGPSSSYREKRFPVMSTRSKHRHAKKYTSTSTEELLFVTKSRLWTEGKHAASDLLKQSTETSPTRAVKIRDAFRKSNTPVPITPYTEDEALAYMMDCKLTKENYIHTRKGAIQRGADLYPPYSRVLEAKRRCYPENMTITETSASVLLQSLLDHTAERICDMICFNYNEKESDAIFIFKWGCDGSSGRSEYNQKFQAESASDSYLFLISAVPLKLQTTNNVLLWKNPKPSSIRYCRPIKFEYQKETAEYTRQEVGNIEKEIKSLKKFNVEKGGKILKIEYKLLFTMNDGKVISAISNVPTQNCYICYCKPSEMNNIGKAKGREINEENLKYGLSTLHAWIKFLECVLHISYKLDLGTTTIRGASEEQKRNLEERKKTIRTRLWREVGIRVDKVVQGKGTSNTGNVARKFFANAEMVANITGVNVELIKRFGNILTTISCGYPINLNKFEAYTDETARLYVDLYNWYKMPPSVHKILIHGPIIIENSIVPIGELSEEAQECKNKEYGYFREHHSRKSSRQFTNTDLFNFMMISSDPIISNKRKQYDSKRNELPSQVKELLQLNEKDNEVERDSD